MLSNFQKVRKILIADSGSTKTDWVKVCIDDCSIVDSETITSPGLNPVLISSAEIESQLDEIRNKLGKDFECIRFYGAGAGDKKMVSKMEDCIRNKFVCTDIKADSDLAGAALAALGPHPGIACIMGTGSSSCHYNGSVIDRKNPSLGYVLDDNGGGVGFGRRLLSDVFKEIAPGEIRAAFHSKYNLTVADVVNALYNRPCANRWIAGFMPFITEHQTHTYMQDLIESQLRYFFQREFFSYSEKELRHEGIGFIGSVAGILTPFIQKLASENGWKIRNIVRKPIELLVQNVCFN